MTDLLTGALPPVTLADEIHEIKRELTLRARVYPRWVETGRLKQATADENVRRMEATLARLMREQTRKAAE